MNRLHALVLAAGAGSRFGGGKLLAPWREGVLLDGALEAALAAPVDQVTLVTGADAEAVAQAARTRAGARPLKIVHAADFAHGLSASLAAGIRSLPDDARGVLVFLGDMPLVPASTVRSLVAALEAGAAACAPVHKTQRGNPAGFSQALFEEVVALRGDRGAGRILENLGDRLVLVDCPDPGVLTDIDTPAELAVITLSSKLVS